MQIFNVFFKISKKKILIGLMYVVIFAVIGFTMIGTNKETSNFAETKVKVSVIDNDNTEESKMLIDFIGERHKLIDIDNTKNAKLDSLYYFEVEYILTIKEGYSEKLKNNDTEYLFESVRHPSTYTASYLESQINEYVSSVVAFHKVGNEIKVACEKAENLFDTPIDVTTETFTDENSIDESSGFFFQYLPYLYISILISCLCPIIVTINREDLRYRTNASPLPSLNKTIQTILASILYVAIIWIIFMLLYMVFRFITNKELSFEFTKREFLAIFNSIIIILVSTAIAILVVQFSPKDEILSMIGNIIGLGSSFLCGVFVPQDMLGENVILAARFLPIYWYVKANNCIFAIAGETFNEPQIYKCIAVEALFAIPLFALIFLLSKIKNSSSKSI
ncbi:MAG: ABC transporter permease [Ruminococcus sp.]|nr:ABC transporter permease [Ruminococcus sp.]